MIKKIHTEDAPKAIGPYVQANQIGTLIFTSGQLGINPETGQLETGIEAQTVQIFKNLSAVLEAGNSDLNHVIKTTVFLKNLDYFAQVNEIYARYFNEVLPARSAFQVGKLPMDAEIEIEVIAHIR
ncbi:RidA family protein [Erysipelothrix tonsillarum]|uniref:RidA family protein n=1 Tax=Erysipelothrix tonsillarum TaxID=38402 RepID=UPI00037DC6EC|nr:RidA family protein [Erysipelothrix tonsillarum]